MNKLIYDYNVENRENSDLTCCAPPALLAPDFVFFLKKTL